MLSMVANAIGVSTGAVGRAEVTLETRFERLIAGQRLHR
jgi:hypothetical protein